MDTSGNSKRINRSEVKLFLNLISGIGNRTQRKFVTNQKATFVSSKNGFYVFVFDVDVSNLILYSHEIIPFMKLYKIEHEIGVLRGRATRICRLNPTNGKYSKHTLTRTP